MSGRRQEPRYRLSVPFEGSLQLLQDVLIEARSDREVWIRSRSPINTGETLALDLVNGGTSTLPVKVIESKPVIIDGDVRYRIRLAITDVESSDART